MALAVEMAAESEASVLVAAREDMAGKARTVVRPEVGLVMEATMEASRQKNTLLLPHSSQRRCQQMCHSA